MQIKRYSIAILFLVCLMCCRYTAHAQCTSRYQDTIFSKIDSTMNVTIDLVKGTTDLKVEEEDPLFSFASQNQQANEFMSK